MWSKIHWNTPSKPSPSTFSLRAQKQAKAPTPTFHDMGQNMAAELTLQQRSAPYNQYNPTYIGIFLRSGISTLPRSILKKRRINAQKQKSARTMISFSRMTNRIGTRSWSLWRNYIFQSTSTLTPHTRATEKLITIEHLAFSPLGGARIAGSTAHAYVKSI